MRKLSNFYKYQGLILVKKEVDKIELLTPVREVQSRVVFGNEVNTDYRLPFTVTLPDGRSIIQALDSIHTGVCDIINDFHPF